MAKSSAKAAAAEAKPPPAKRRKVGGRAAGAAIKTLKGLELVGELRNKVWDHLFASLMGHEPQAQRRYMIIDDEGKARLSKANTFTIDEVQSSGKGQIFSLPMSDLPQEFHEFLSQVSDKVLFTFVSPKALKEFALLLRGYLDVNPDLRTIIRVEIPLFRGEKWKSLDTWETTKWTPHGDREGAREHAQEWFDVALLLPPETIFTIHLYHPWRDYRHLSGAVAYLRDYATSDLELSVVDFKPWGQIPQWNHHLALMGAAVQNVKVEFHNGIDSAQAEVLCDHGCRGFRGPPGSQ
ncbi:Hypothetical protein D9617_36g063300 [Elsinoe fawcettii]|nr:Hypothetical protein D9617_36g063300 [Elsinoe fawcettii]